ncbi:hypothetical protein K435DRAFT_811672 [Dendrothele bispora CBS 962.96]|uniref:FAD/NAD(P)-binding domain-containing protein n=1 Tax=Dendrothele bispora (strain CBS 962.96) TaxID=1314807 RepID=A0A4S8KSD7_DENBC|nr:hypothetical protein K435DRAFT_811672 [Dendrothele bispora CBS 962.96]
MCLGPIGVIRLQPAIYLAQANFDSVVFKGFMGNGFTAGSRCTATVNVENFHGFPTGILSPEMMDKFHVQSLRLGTRIITETISKINLSHCPFRYWREGQEDEESETADMAIVATGASAKEVGIERRRVCDGAVPIFRNTTLAVIGGGDSAAEEATYLTKYGSYVYVILPKRQGNVKPLKNPQIRDVQTGEEKDLAVNGLFYTLEVFLRLGMYRIRGRDKGITSAGSGCMAALEAERLIVESEEKEMMGE